MGRTLIQTDSPCDGPKPVRRLRTVSFAPLFMMLFLSVDVALQICNKPPSSFYCILLQRKVRVKTFFSVANAWIKKGLQWRQKFSIVSSMKTKPIKLKMSAMELAALCGVHIDTIYRSRRRRFCTYRMARILNQVTTIPVDDWVLPDKAPTDPWDRVLKK